MPTEIKMPALSPTMEEGTLAKWLVKEGDTVKSGDILAEIETDKATMEFEAVDEGTIASILVPEGSDNVKVGTVIATIAGEGEDAGAAATASTTGTAPSAGSTPATGEGGVQTPSDQRTEFMSDAPKAQETGTAQLVTDKAAAVRDPEVPAGTEMAKLTVREALRDAMAEEMRADRRIFVMGEEVAEYQGAYKVTQGLLDEFGPKRVIDTPITEYGFAGVGTGAAMGGLRPIVEFMTFNFAMQAIDQIINSAAKTLYMSGGQMGAPMVFRGPNGAAARVGAQHSQDYAAWYASIPGLKVVMPYSAADAKGLMKTAIRDANPVIFLENEILYGKSFEVPKMDDFAVPFGKAKVWREGKDATIVSWGIGMTYALDAASKLAEDGIDVEVIDLRTLRPVDYDAILRSVEKTNRCVVVEEGFPVASFSDHIASVVMQRAFDHLDAPVVTCTGKDVPMPYAANLEKLALVTTTEVVEAVRQVTYR